MTIVDKSYTIRYSKGGIWQYADFRYCKGKLVSNGFHPSWVKSDEVPSLEGLEDIEDILAVIKNFSYNNNADIMLVDGLLPEYAANEVTRTYIKECSNLFDEFVTKMCAEFFKKNLLHYMLKNDWKVSYSWCGRPIIVEYVGGRWDNISDRNKEYILMDYTCNVFTAGVLGLGSIYDMRSEGNYYAKDGFPLLCKHILEEDLEEMCIFLNPESE